MRDSKGRFVKGQHSHQATEFKQGQHWRKPQLFREYDWLYNEYTTLQRPAASIAEQFGVTENAILFWLHKLEIPRRNMKSIRKIKRWGLSGAANGMFGVHGEDHPNWRGGSTPERQGFYSSEEWVAVSRIVWLRDKRTCRRCGISKARTSQSFHIHHLISFVVKDFRADVDNLVVLCAKCHYWVHSKQNTNREWLVQPTTPNKEVRTL